MQWIISFGCSQRPNALFQMRCDMWNIEQSSNQWTFHCTSNATCIIIVVHTKRSQFPVVSLSAVLYEFSRHEEIYELRFVYLPFQRSKQKITVSRRFQVTMQKIDLKYPISLDLAQEMCAHCVASKWSMRFMDLEMQSERFISSLNRFKYYMICNWSTHIFASSLCHSQKRELTTVTVSFRWIWFIWHKVCVKP